MSLDLNAIKNLYNIHPLPDYKPIVQVLDMKLLDHQRYRIIISDGEFYQQALITRQNNELITSGIIKIHDFIKINDYVANIVCNTKILIIIKFEHVSSHNSRIADPVKYIDIISNS